MERDRRHHEGRQGRDVARRRSSRAASAARRPAVRATAATSASTAASSVEGRQPPRPARGRGRRPAPPVTRRPPGRRRRRFGRRDPARHRHSQADDDGRDREREDGELHEPGTVPNVAERVGSGRRAAGARSHSGPRHRLTVIGRFLRSARQRGDASESSSTAIRPSRMRTIREAADADPRVVRHEDDGLPARCEAGSAAR